MLASTACSEARTVSFTGVDRHPGKIPDAHKETVLVVANADRPSASVEAALLTLAGL